MLFSKNDSTALRSLALCLALSLLTLPAAFGAQIKGAGSTAAARLYQDWADAFKITGNQVAYEANGSSAGIQAVIEGRADFGATDVPLSEDRLRKEGLICIPTAITGIAPAMNLPGVPRGKLHLSGPVLAAILSGKVHSWNDEAIRHLNPGLKLPAEAIHVIAREDGSGTTWVLSKYLASISPEWQQEMGNDFKLHWPTGTTLARGGSGMVAQIKQTPFSIGYLEVGNIDAAQLNYALVANKAGRYVEPQPEAFRAALGASKWTFEGRFEESLTNLDDKDAWPITTGTFIVMKRLAADPKRTAIVLNFFSGAFMQADKLVPQSGYIPLPMKTQARAVKELGAIEERQGIPLFFDVMWRPAKR